MPYQPFEFTVPPEQEWVLDVPAIEGPRANPPRAIRRSVKRHAQQQVIPSETFKGLRVQVALLRDPSWNEHAAEVVSSAHEIFQLFEHTRFDVQESFWVVILNVKLYVTGIYEVARGSLESVEVRSSDVFRAVLVAGATAFIVVHNHPSGSAEPSHLDVNLTQHIASGAFILGLKFLDHVVIGRADRAGFTSFAETRPRDLEPTATLRGALLR